MQNIIPKIHIELVPKTCFFTNVRSQVAPEDWDIIRKQAYKNSNYRCDVCGDKGKMEAHEIWHYDDHKLIQKLAGITCVCSHCHQLYHLGYASTQGKLPQAITRLSRINNWKKEETESYVEAVFEIWYKRSQKQWILDLTLLDKINIKYSLSKPGQRAKISDEKLKKL